MRRELWLVTVFAALFVLQGPLCILACLDHGDPAADVAAVAAHVSTSDTASGDAGEAERHAASHPCHDAGPPASPGPVPPASHEGCGCEAANPASMPVPFDLASTLASVAAAPAPRDATMPAPRRIDRDAAIAEAIDLPPPDLLLLHSTLLI